MQYAFKMKGGSASTSAFRMNIQFFMNSPASAHPDGSIGRSQMEGRRRLGAGKKVMRFQAFAGFFVAFRKRPRKRMATMIPIG